MLAINIKRARLAISRSSTLVAAFAMLLLLGASGRGAVEIESKDSPETIATRSVGGAATASSPPSINKFEISLYLVESGQSGQNSVPYTTQLYRALEQRNGWVSEVDESNENVLETREHCKNKNEVCDVVGVAEDYGEDRMTLTLTVYSLPESSHKNLHRGGIDGKEYRCNPLHCGREGCRAHLIQDIVEDLAGLDKDHKVVR